MRLIMDAVRSIRNTRAEMNVPPSRRAKAIFVVGGQTEADTIKEASLFFERLCFARREARGVGTW